MSGLRRAAEFGVDALQRLIGRRRVVRLARFLTNQSRLDGTNDMSRNGEATVQHTLLAHSAPAEPIVVFDVGANRGEWSIRLLHTAERLGRGSIALHAFEPCDATFGMLRNALRQGYGARTASVITRRLALSSAAGTAMLHVVDDGSGINSLHEHPDETTRREEVPVTTIDAHCAALGIPHLALVKIDTEGHDMDVLQGAAGMLGRGAVDVVQFEYNWRWIDSRHYLRDAFGLVEPLDYAIGKVTPRGIEFYARWHPELESFREANYILCRRPWMNRFPRITWWNDA